MSVIDTDAQGIVDVISGLSGVKGRLWAPPGGDTDSLPAGVVYLPIIDRSAVDAAEDHLGANDWHLDYPVVLYFDSTDITFGQTQAAEVTEAFIKAIDADQTLGGVVQEAKVIHVDEPQLIELNARPTLQVKTRVGVLDFV